MLCAHRVKLRGSQSFASVSNQLRQLRLERQPTDESLLYHRDNALVQLLAEEQLLFHDKPNSAVLQMTLSQTVGLFFLPILHLLSSVMDFYTTACTLRFHYHNTKH